MGCRFYQGLQHLAPALCSDELQQETRRWAKGGPPIWYVLDALDELHEQEQRKRREQQD
jgi:hypothetical protein